MAKKNGSSFVFAHFQKEQSSRIDVGTSQNGKNKRFVKHDSVSFSHIDRARLDSEQWIKKYINWNTIPIFYAFKSFYNKQTIAYVSRTAHCDLCMFVLHFSLLFPMKWRYYSHRVWAYGHICSFCLNLFRKTFTCCTETELHCSRAMQKRRKKKWARSRKDGFAHIFARSKFETIAIFAKCTLHSFMQLKKKKSSDFSNWHR